MLRQLPDIDPEEQAFLREIRFAPEDQEQRDVYADWLEERGDPRAEFLRVDRELSETDPAQSAHAARRGELTERRTALIKKIDARWISFICDAPIEKCSPEFSYLCPMRWDALRVLDDDPAIRYCDQCGREVHYCQDVEQARQHASQSHCVAIDASAMRQPGDLDNLEDDPHTGALLGILDIDS